MTWLTVPYEKVSRDELEFADDVILDADRHVAYIKTDMKPVAWRVGDFNFYTLPVAKAQAQIHETPLLELYALGESND